MTRQDAGSGPRLPARKRSPAESVSIQVTTEFLDDLAQVSRVLLNDSARFLQARRLWLRMIFTGARFVRWLHPVTVGRQQKGALS